MSVLEFIASSNYIVLNKQLIKEIGIEESLLLGELASEYDYWQKRGELVDGYFYSTIENVEENTTLNSYKQRKALKNLQEKNLIDIKLKGMPAKRYIKIFEEQVVKILNINKLKNYTSRCLKFTHQDVKNLNINNNKINNNKINNNNNKNNNIIINNNIIEKKKFKPPTLEEVKEYCKQRNNNVDPKKFFDYYEVGDWKDSKGNKLKNWKQKLITWEKHSPTQQKSGWDYIDDQINDIYDEWKEEKCKEKK